MKFLYCQKKSWYFKFNFRKNNLRHQKVIKWETAKSFKSQQNSWTQQELEKSRWLFNVLYVVFYELSTEASYFS